MSVDLIVLNETRSTSGHDEELEHWFCPCAPEVALCGEDIAGDPETEAIESPDDCVVCGE